MNFFFTGTLKNIVFIYLLGKVERRGDKQRKPFRSGAHPSSEAFHSRAGWAWSCTCVSQVGGDDQVLESCAPPFKGAALEGS